MAYLIAIGVFIACVSSSICQDAIAMPKPYIPYCPLRHGFCPLLVTPNPYPSQICKEDRHCSTKQKCCRDRCGGIGGLCRPFCPLPCDCQVSQNVFIPNPCYASPCQVPGAFCRPYNCNGQAHSIWYSVNAANGECKIVAKCPSTVKG